MLLLHSKRAGGKEGTGWRDERRMLLLYRRRRLHRLFVVTTAPHDALHTTLVNIKTNSNINGDDSCSAMNDYDKFLVFLVLRAAVPSIDASFLQNADAEFCADKGFNNKRRPVKKREREGGRERPQHYWKQHNVVAIDKRVLSIGRLNRFETTPPNADL
jgi:hypothetical protein